MVGEKELKVEEKRSCGPGGPPCVSRTVTKEAVFMEQVDALRLSLSLHVFSVFSTPTREALRALVPHFHLLMSSPPTQRSLQANHRLRGQKYSKWNCSNSGVWRISRKNAMSRSDSVRMMRRRSKTKRSPMVTRSRRSTLKTNLFTCSVSLSASPPALCKRPAALLSAPNSAMLPTVGVPASDSFSSSMLQGAPLIWREAASSRLCSATGVGSMLSEGL